LLAEDNPPSPRSYSDACGNEDALKKAQMDDIQRVRKAGNSKGRKIVTELNDSLMHFLELCGVDK